MSTKLDKAIEAYLQKQEAEKKAEEEQKQVELEAETFATGTLLPLLNSIKAKLEAAGIQEVSLDPYVRTARKPLQHGINFGGKSLLILTVDGRNRQVTITSTYRSAHMKVAFQDLTEDLLSDEIANNLK